MIAGKIYSRSDGSYIIEHNGNPYHVTKGDPIMDEVFISLANNPAIPEPSPEPTPEARAAAARPRTLADLAALDARAIRPLLAISAGTATDADHKKISELEAEAAKIRKGL